MSGQRQPLLTNSNIRSEVHIHIFSDNVTFISLLSHLNGSDCLDQGSSFSPVFSSNLASSSSTTLKQKVYRQDMAEVPDSKHLIGFIKDLLNRDNFRYVELQHILNSVLESHNAAWARSTRALTFQSWLFLLKVAEAGTCIFSLTMPSSKPM